MSMPKKKFIVEKTKRICALELEKGVRAGKPDWKMRTYRQHHARGVRPFRQREAVRVYESRRVVVDLEWSAVVIGTKQSGAVARRRSMVVRWSGRNVIFHLAGHV